MHSHPQMFLRFYICVSVYLFHCFTQFYKQIQREVCWPLRLQQGEDTEVDVFLFLPLSTRSESPSSKMWGPPPCRPSALLISLLFWIRGWNVKLTAYPLPQRGAWFVKCTLLLSSDKSTLSVLKNIPNTWFNLKMNKSASISVVFLWLYFHCLQCWLIYYKSTTTKTPPSVYTSTQPSEPAKHLSLSPRK